MTTTPAEPRREVGQVEHTADCTGSRLVRHETTHRHLLVCTACGARVTVPRRNEWRG